MHIVAAACRSSMTLRHIGRQKLTFSSKAAYTLCLLLAGFPANSTNVRNVRIASSSQYRNRLVFFSAEFKFLRFNIYKKSIVQISVLFLLVVQFMMQIKFNFDNFILYGACLPELGSVPAAYGVVAGGCDWPIQ